MIWLVVVLLTALAAYHIARWNSAVAPVSSDEPTAPLAVDVNITFLVPCWNAASDIPQFVRAFEGLEQPGSELILCAGGEDGSYEVANAHASNSIRVLQQARGEGKQGALARSLPLATGDVIFLTDIDCRPTSAVVDNLVAPLVDGTAAITTGPSKPLPRQLDNPFVLLQWATELITQAGQPQPTDGILGRNAALLRSVLERTAAFAVPAPSGTDYTLAKVAQEAGYAVLFVPGRPMPAVYPERLGAYVRKQARWIRNVFVLGLRYGAMTEVGAATITLAFPLLLVALVWAGSAIDPVFTAVALVLTAHSVLNRLYYQRRAGIDPSLIPCIVHFFADQAASLRASWQIVRGYRSW